MMTTHRVVIASILLLAGLLVWQLESRPPQEQPVRVLLASWADAPETLEEAVALSEEIVLGKVVRVRRARDLTVPAPGEPDNVHRVPVETVTFQLEKTYKAPGDRRGRPASVEVFHTGGRTENDRAIMLEGDPEYTPGERYVLFLTNGPQLTVNGTRLASRAVISPEGRFGVDRDGQLMPASTLGRGFAEANRGRSLEALESALARQIRPTEGN
jgi:hypothetical protein